METSEISGRIPVGISSCLIGEKVRFDGGHKNNAYIVQTLGLFFAFRPFCPEVDIGLGIPREPIRLVERDGQLRCVGTRDPALVRTEALVDCADRQRGWQQDIFGYILKKDSPSCGMERVKVYEKNMPSRAGAGIFAARMMASFPDLPVEEEGRLGDPVLRENFVQRVFIYWRWHEAVAAQPSWSRLTRFHARHKLVLMSHDQNLARALGRELAAAADGDLAAYLPRYRSRLMAILSIRATRGNHVNVLQHIQGYLKTQLSADDKRELADSIEHYRQGLLPLIVPITLLRHFFRLHPHPYIEDSHYLHPHPRELMLLNSL